MKFPKFTAARYQAYYDGILQQKIEEALPEVEEVNKKIQKWQHIYDVCGMINGIIIVLSSLAALLIYLLFFRHNSLAGLISVSSVAFIVIILVCEFTFISFQISDRYSDLTKIKDRIKNEMLDYDVHAMSIYFDEPEKSMCSLQYIKVLEFMDTIRALETVMDNLSISIDNYNIGHTANISCIVDKTTINNTKITCLVPCENADEFVKIKENDFSYLDRYLGGE